jgi:hypothetical protein
MDKQRDILEKIKKVYGQKHKRPISTEEAEQIKSQFDYLASFILDQYEIEKFGKVLNEQ